MVRRGGCVDRCARRLLLRRRPRVRVDRLPRRAPRAAAGRRSRRACRARGATPPPRPLGAQRQPELPAHTGDWKPHPAGHAHGRLPAPRAGRAAAGAGAPRRDRVVEQPAGRAVLRPAGGPHPPHGADPAGGVRAVPPGGRPGRAAGLDLRGAPLSFDALDGSRGGLAARAIGRPPRRVSAGRDLAGAARGDGHGRIRSAALGPGRRDDAGRARHRAGSCPRSGRAAMAGRGRRASRAGAGHPVGPVRRKPSGGARHQAHAGAQLPPAFVRGAADLDRRVSLVALGPKAMAGRERAGGTPGLPPLGQLDGHARARSPGDTPVGSSGAGPAPADRLARRTRNSPRVLDAGQYRAGLRVQLPHRAPRHCGRPLGRGRRAARSCRGRRGGAADRDHGKPARGASGQPGRPVARAPRDRGRWLRGGGGPAGPLDGVRGDPADRVDGHREPPGTRGGAARRSGRGDGLEHRGSSGARAVARGGSGSRGGGGAGRPARDRLAGGAGGLSRRAVPGRHPVGRGRVGSRTTGGRCSGPSGTRSSRSGAGGSRRSSSRPRPGISASS